MGVEAFVVKLTGTRHPLPEVLQHLLHIPEVRPADLERSSKVTQYLLYQDGAHVIELRLDDEAHPIARCRFALCNPASVDTVVARLLLSLSARFEFTITILDEVADGHPHVFLPPTYEQFAEVLRRSVAVQRAAWKANFGAVEAGITTAEALRRFVL